MIPPFLHAVVKNFNPRPPRGGRLLTSLTSALRRLFQSTPPARGATRVFPKNSNNKRNFNPRPPRGGRQRGRRHQNGGSAPISIHAPREGGDTAQEFAVQIGTFQSTPPARGATARLCNRKALRKISIHAPREGGDPSACLRIKK